MKPGETFAQGKYTLIRKLRSSGMAEVWLARQHGTEGFAKDVVIKRILPHLAEDDKLVHMFLDEARLAANLNHPNVVHIFDLGSDGQNYFIAMEYIRGHDLEQIQEQLKLRHMPFPAELAAQIVSNTCLGLAYAHDCKTADGTPMQVVHRDVSPQNILVSETGVVKLIDFGIAKARTSSTRTQVGHTKGKICYMSPEQMMARELDRRSDIFSLGVVLYEMCCGTKPFDGDNLLACYHKLKGGIANPREYRPDIPIQLADIIMHALAYDREERFPTATAFRYELQRYLNQEGVAIGPEHLADFLTWLFSPPDSTQFVFDFPRKKEVAPAAQVAMLPPLSTQDYPQRVTPPPQPAVRMTPAFSAPVPPLTGGIQPTASPLPGGVGHSRSFVGPSLVIDDVTTAEAPPSLRLGSEPQFLGLRTPPNNIGTGPELGVVPLDMDDDHNHPYSRRRRKQGSSFLMFLIPVLLLGGGAAGAYFLGLFQTTPATTTPNPPPIISAQEPPQAGGADAGTVAVVPDTPVQPQRLDPPQPIARPRPEEIRPRPRPVVRRPVVRARHPRRNRPKYCRVIVNVHQIHKARVMINGGEYIRLPMSDSIRIPAGKNRFFFMWPSGSKTKQFHLRGGGSVVEINCHIEGDNLSCSKRSI